jgi:hypothetical protein
VKITNYRLELAFLIPDDKKLSVDEVKATVENSLKAINKDSLKQMKKGAVRFESLQDLEDYDLQLQKLKREWNSTQKAKKGK